MVCKILFYSNNHNGIVLEIDIGFTLKSSRAAAVHLYMLQSFISFVAFVHTNYSVNLPSQTLYVRRSVYNASYFIVLTYNV
jgi:hypothetical protein